MTIYVPNVGEKEMLKEILLSEAIVLGLYKNQVLPDGNTTIDTLQEMPTGGGRAYAQKPLSNAVVEDGSLVADKWRVTTDAYGKAEGQYSNAAVEWTFNETDAGDQNTVYGFFGYSWVLPFTNGAKEIKVGDTVKGATSGATGIVTEVNVQSGSWAGGDAAGALNIMTKTGTWQNGENILLSGEVGTINNTPTAGGTGYAVGDLLEITPAGGGSGALAIVTGVSAGAVTSLHLATGGRGYATGSGLATTALTGAGSGCTVEITALASAAYAVTNTGATGDAHRKLKFVEPLSEGYLIDTAGQKITYVPKITLSTAA
ncbi:MAG: hypothetical protein QME75_12410 [Deltaproteobacteria bacterium]|nr:hypothetical protein [Deltaproteobacteria bacterium]